MVNLSRVDLNLLVVLETILSEGGVSRAAAKLNLTQPTISHALARLREQFDDPLFVRHGRTLAPTPLARSLREPLAAALHSLGGVLAAGRRFDPAQTAATFTVAMRDPMELVVLPALARQLAAAPQVELRAVQVRRRSDRGSAGRRCARCGDRHGAAVLRSHPAAQGRGSPTISWSWRGRTIRACAASRRSRPTSTSST